MFTQLYNWFLTPTPAPAVASASSGVSYHRVHALSAPYLTTIDPTNVAKAAVRNCLEELLSSYLVYRTEAGRKQLADTRKLRDLMNKYPVQQNQYETFMQGHPTGNRRHFSPLLIDVLCSGLHLPLTFSASPAFGDEQAADVRTLLEILPSCASSRFGEMCCRTKVFPLYIACMNEQVGLNVVNMLIEAAVGSVIPHSTLRVDEQYVGILEDAKYVVSTSRFEQLEALFAEYA
jgi:hypothetical protein